MGGGMRIDAAKHFTDRFEEMSVIHDGLTREEVRACVEHPDQVFKAGRRVTYRRGRIDVVAQRWRDVLYLITVKWVDPSMYEKNPGRH